MKHSLALLLLAISLTSIAQINYEEGYFVDNNNKRTSCLIKNEDWLRNPVSLEYKLNSSADPLTIQLKDLKEFQVASNKYVRATVKMDTSSQITKTLTSSRKPLWKEKDVLLKVLVEGKGDLFMLDQKDLVLFFFRVDSASIEQLEYKSYLTRDNHGDISVTINKNLTYINQLKSQVSCGEEFSKVAQNKMRYEKEFLTNYFIRYNKCSGSALNTFKPDKNLRRFHLRITPGMDFSAAKIQYTTAPDNDFPARETRMRIGLEAEFILPFNKNKWGLFIEPTYQSYESKSPVVIHYRSLEIPFGLRHYLYLNENARLFLNAAVVFDIPMEYSAELTRSILLEAEFFKINLAGGVGFNYKKFSIEGRYYSFRTGLDNRYGYHFDFVKSSIILGYRLF